MSLPQLEIFAKDVDEAREEIFRVLPMMDRSVRIIYFDGWGGFGVSAVLRSIAKVLPSVRTAPELCFDRIIHIDCSEWKSERTMQRLIAEELKLDHSVISILDKQDEEDDFSGVDESSRSVIERVGQMIDQTLRGSKFMMIFLNGSDVEFDIGAFGPPFARFGDNMMIWTFKRRFLTMNHWRSEIADKLRYTHTLSCVHPMITERLTSSEFQAILREEAAAIVARSPCMLDIDPTMVADCCLYQLFLDCNFHTFQWVAHASNCWMCDGIIQGDRARDISIALHGKLNWERGAPLVNGMLRKFMKHTEPPFLILQDDDVYEERPYRWISVTSRNTKLHGLQTIPAAASSFFLAFERSDYPIPLPHGLFEHSNNLGVLVLCCCAFSFAAPPFLKSHRLRFLGLDCCIDDQTGGGQDHREWASLYSLWVLHLSYTDWNEILSEEKMDLMTNIKELNIEGTRCWQYIADLQGRLPNLQRLRIIKPTCQWETSRDVGNSFMDKTRIEILDLSGNTEMEVVPTSLSKASGLRVLVLDGCDGVENIDGPGGLPSSIESFSFDGYGPAFEWTPSIELPFKHFCPPTTTETNNRDIKVSKISLAGCKQLKNLFLRGLPNLLELDLSGTAIKILDFETMVVQVPGLKRLFLIGCEHLRAINFPGKSDFERNLDLELLYIDTRPEAACDRSTIEENNSSQLQVNAIITDARLVRSLHSLIYYGMNSPRDVCFDIQVTSSPVSVGPVQPEAPCSDKIGHSEEESLNQLVPAHRYSDVSSMIGDASLPMQAFPPPPMKLDRHVEIAEGSHFLESELDKYRGLGGLMDLYAESLHVHDVPVCAIVPPPFWGNKLRHFCVERCSKVDAVFQTSPDGLLKLETLWVSHLLMARWICSKGYHFTGGTFRSLQHLHVRSCPSLQFVLPVWFPSFPSLKTLYIIHCSNLKHIFTLDNEYPEEIAVQGVLFPKLTTIHLHDLPELQQICEFKMVAPAVKTIVIRRCWNLCHPLPVVATDDIEIEKDGCVEVDAGHHPDSWTPRYKMKLPRVSVLR
ncbi:hypothetical protein CFC21_085326 [Triticum aestivum]|uniref:Disease resistance protein At4g27190-like leucine-rich repeats domain-containing protein n=3 Tax=Triticum TaxID=4564 RepID=A0A3B6NV36_WHEAT|nr:hypothetical protein CFC21_085326 [Triticum aestivum]